MFRYKNDTDPSISRLAFENTQDTNSHKRRLCPLLPRALLHLSTASIISIDSPLIQISPLWISTPPPPLSRWPLLPLTGSSHPTLTFKKSWSMRLNSSPRATLAWLSPHSPSFQSCHSRHAPRPTSQPMLLFRPARTAI